MEVSVVIPTYNRADTLRECLELLVGQKFVKDEYEIVVVDDGSTDSTADVVKIAQKSSKIPIKYLYQKNQGQGIARNYGIKHAHGKIIILVGDDILVKRDFISEHIKFHRKHKNENEAVLGFIGWDPRLEINPFMEWLTNGSSVMGKFGGHQFAFEKLKGKKFANYNFFYTSNISIKRSLLMRNPFDTRFSSYGWEDIELGYRLTKKEGLKLHYNPKAVAYHFHPMDEQGLANRMRNIGKSAHLIHRKYPELKKVPSKLKQSIFALLSHPISIWILKKLRELSNDKYYTLYYYALSKKYFLEGLREGH
ncbi:glycosyltransferase family 2 protein [Patescibacteria group bacterium]